MTEEELSKPFTHQGKTYPSFKAYMDEVFNVPLMDLTELKEKMERKRLERFQDIRRFSVYYPELGKEDTIALWHEKRKEAGLE